MKSYKIPPHILLWICISITRVVLINLAINLERFENYSIVIHSSLPLTPPGVCAKLPRAKPNSNKEVNFLMRCQFGVFEKYKNVCLCRAGRDQ